MSHLRRQSYRNGARVALRPGGKPPAGQATDRLCLTSLKLLLLIIATYTLVFDATHAIPREPHSDRQLIGELANSSSSQGADTYKAVRNECLVSIREQQSATFSAQAQARRTSNILTEAGAIDIEPVFTARADGAGGVGAMTLSSSYTDTIYRVRLENGTMETTSVTEDPAAAASQCEVFTTLPGVIAAQPNLIYSGSLLPNDPLIDHNTRVAHVESNAHAAWDITTGSPDVIVAVVDSGVSPHTELAGRLLRGYDFVNSDNDANDDSGHGSQVAGVVAAAGNNGVGAAGVAWGSRILPVKVLDHRAQGTTASIIAGIQYAVDQGARIVNLSLGQIHPDPALQAAVQYALANGSLPIAAVGNEGREAKRYPAAYPEVLAVGSHWDAWAYAGFSNFGPWVDISAPGLNLVTIKHDGVDFTEASGTSVSAPFVAGAGALVLSVSPELTPQQLRARLLATAYGGFYSHPANSEHMYNKRLGVGSIDLAAAVTDSSERTSVAKISVVRAGLSVSEALLQRGVVYNLEVEVENLTQSDRSATVEVLSNEAHLLLTGTGARSRTLATGTPLLETGYTLQVAAEAVPNRELNLTVRITPSSGPPEDHNFVVTPTFDYAVGWPQTIPVCNVGTTATEPAFVIQAGNNVSIYQANWNTSTLYSFHPDGSTLYPALYTPNVLYTPVTANLSSDVAHELVFPVVSTEDGAYVEALRTSDYTALTGWPIVQQGFSSGLTGFDIEAANRIAAADIDRDGFDEILVAEKRFFRQLLPWAVGGVYQTRVYALRRDGTLMPGWPQMITGQISSQAAPVAGDVSGDTQLEIILPIETESMATSTSDMYPPPPPVLVFSADGTLLRTLLPNSGLSPRCGYASEGAALADFDDDGKMEIVRDYGGCGLQVWRGDGSQLPGFPSLGGRSFTDVPPGVAPRTLGAAPAIADIDDDGSLDIVVSAAGFRTTGPAAFDPVDYATTLVVVGSNGVSLSGYPKLLETLAYPNQYWVPKYGTQPVLVDIDGDGEREIFVQSRVKGVLFGFTGQGQQVAGFPIRFRRFASNTTSYSFADIDLDGTFELLSAADFEDALTIYDLPFRYASSSSVAVDPVFAPWPRDAADLQRSCTSPDQAANYLAGAPVVTPTATPTSTATPTTTVTPTPTSTNIPNSEPTQSATPTSTPPQTPTSPTNTPTPKPTSTPAPLASVIPSPTPEPAATATLDLNVKQVSAISSNRAKLRARAEIQGAASDRFNESTARVSYICTLKGQETSGRILLPLGSERSFTLRNVRDKMRCTFTAALKEFEDSEKTVTLRRRP